MSVQWSLSGMFSGKACVSYLVVTCSRKISGCYLCTEKYAENINVRSDLNGDKKSQPGIWCPES